MAADGIEVKITAVSIKMNNKNFAIHLSCFAGGEI